MNVYIAYTCGIQNGALVCRNVKSTAARKTSNHHHHYAKDDANSTNIDRKQSTHGVTCVTQDDHQIVLLSLIPSGELQRYTGC
ncbi:unnamed protein product [Pylaiella littoralis]